MDLVGESGVNFGEFTPRSEMRDCSLITCDQWKILRILLSVCWSSTPSSDVDDLYLYGQLVSIWMASFYICGALSLFSLLNVVFDVVGLGRTLWIDYIWYGAPSTLNIIYFKNGTKRKIIICLTFFFLGYFLKNISK